VYFVRLNQPVESFQTKNRGNHQITSDQGEGHSGTVNLVILQSAQKINVEPVKPKPHTISMGGDQKIHPWTNRKTQKYVKHIRVPKANYQRVGPGQCRRRACALPEGFDEQSCQPMYPLMTFLFTVTSLILEDSHNAPAAKWILRDTFLFGVVGREATPVPRWLAALRRVGRP